MAELLIVVAIIGVLVAVAIPIFSGLLEKARTATCAANRRSLLGEITTAVILDDGLNNIIGTSEKEWESVKSEFEKAGYRFSDTICPEDGKITVQRISENGGFVVKCDKHMDSSDESGNDSDTEQDAYKTILNNFSEAIEECDKKGGWYGNTGYRNVFYEKNGKKWPTMEINGTTYQIEPYYCQGKEESWLFAREGDGTKLIEGNWNAQLVYNPVNGKWYQYYHNNSAKTHSICFGSLEELDAAVTAVVTDPKASQWREVTDK